MKIIFGNQILRFNPNYKDVYEEIENDIDNNRLLEKISNNQSKRYIIKYIIEYTSEGKEQKSIFKAFSFRELAKYFCFINKNKKVTSKDLEGVIYKRDENQCWITVDSKSCNKLIKNLREEMRLTLLGGVSC